MKNMMFLSWHGNCVPSVKAMKPPGVGMTNRMKRKACWAFAVPAVTAMLTLSAPVSGAVLFADDFNSGASAAWGNQQGNWRDTGGVYDAGSPGNFPITYTDVTTHTALSDFTLDIDVNQVDDGGIWLRSDYNGGAINGVLLVTGGAGGTYPGFYWHTVQNGVFSAPAATPAIWAFRGRMYI
jgi:hypothetical protein